MRILFLVVGGIIGGIVGAVCGVLVATIAGGSNTLMIGFLLLSCAPGGLIVGATLGVIGGLRLVRCFRESSSAKRKSLLISGLLIGIPGLLAAMVWIIIDTHRPPSDEKLLANFQRHETEFNQLIEMLKTDNRLIRVDEDWTDPKQPESIGVSVSRISVYRRLLTTAHVPRGFMARENGENIEFFYWMIGSAISSDTIKGYSYLTIPPANLREGLDSCRPDEQNGAKAYRHIRGNWYLFYEYIPG